MAVWKPANALPLKSINPSATEDGYGGGITTSVAGAVAVHMAERTRKDTSNRSQWVAKGGVPYRLSL